MNPAFASTPLVRLLSQWTPAAPPDAGADLGERLAQWVSAFDAISLHTALRAIQATGAAPVRAPASGRLPVPHAALAKDFAQVRGQQARAIAQAPALPNELTYAPYKRRHLELQRQMGLAVDALRQRVRDALALCGPGLHQLAALDAAMDKVVSPRQHGLLPVAITVLERRFGQLQAAHLKALNDPAQDDPMHWRRPGAWLHSFEQDWHQALCAELDLRLEPVAGLIEATGIELNHSS